MIPQTPQSPREEIEIRITAMLMGELSPDEAAALQTQITADAELTALHTRLQRAAGFVREASAFDEMSAHPAPSQPAQLSTERRARLLAHFKSGAHAAPAAVIVKPKRDWKWAVPIGLAASLMALIGGAMFVNGFALRKGTRNIEKMMARSDSEEESFKLNMASMHRTQAAGVVTHNAKMIASHADTTRDERVSIQLGRRADPTGGQNAADGLAKSAVSVVEEQVRRAGDIENGRWASQPGMIRVNPPGGGGSGSGPAWGLATARGPVGTGSVYLPVAAAEVPASDLFSMPVIPAGGGDVNGGRSERYAVSEPLSTDGKVNISSEVKPHSDVERTEPLSMKMSDPTKRDGVVSATSDAVAFATPRLRLGNTVANPEPAPQGRAFAEKPTQSLASARFENGVMDDGKYALDPAAPAPPDDVALESGKPDRLQRQLASDVSKPLPAASDLPASRVVAKGWGSIDLNEFNETAAGVVSKAGSGTISITNGNTFTDGGTSPGGVIPREIALIGGTKFKIAIAPANPSDPKKSKELAERSAPDASEDSESRLKISGKLGGKKLIEGERAASATRFGDADGRDKSNERFEEGNKGIAATSRGEPTGETNSDEATKCLKDDTNGRLGDKLQTVRNEFQRYPDHPSTTSLGVNPVPMRGRLFNGAGETASGTAAPTRGTALRMGPTTPLALGDPEVAKLEKSHEQPADAYEIDLNLKPQPAEFEGFVNHGSPIQTPSARPPGSAPAASLASPPSEAPFAWTGETAQNTVKWLYLTKDGGLTNNAPVSGKPGDGNSGGSRNSDGKEITGRIAFWTDDDATKVNINTAAGAIQEPPTISAGKADNSVTFAGVVSGSGDVAGLTKAGAGTVQLQGVNTYTGTTTVNAGTLNFSSNGAAELRSPSVTKKSGQRADAEVTREFNDKVKFEAPQLPKILAWDGDGTFAKAGDGNLDAGDAKPEPEAASNREIARGISRETNAKQEAAAGKEALQKKDYEAAFSHYKNASDSIPAGGPVVADSRKAAAEGLAIAGVKLAEQRVTEGYYASAAQTLQEVLKQNPDSDSAQRLLSQVETPEYFNKQITPEHRAKVEEVKQTMIEAKGYADLGRYDLADKKYQDVIARDPYNQAARDGREELANLRMHSARAGYGATRAIAASEVENDSSRVGQREDRKADAKKHAQETPPKTVMEESLVAGSDLGIAEQKKSGGESGKNLADVHEKLGNLEAKPAAAEHPLAQSEFNSEKLYAMTPRLMPRGEDAGLAVLSKEEPAAPKPAPKPLVPQPEVRTGENAFSTFSLNVSDVAFKLAAASLERGAMPDVSTLRSEEFINAFDYRDPEAAPGAPLAFAAERARYPFAQNRDLLRLSVKTAAAGRQAGKPLNVVLLLDNSGSMERADRVRIVRESLRTLSAQLQPQDKLSIVTFSRTPRLWADGIAGDKAAEATARVGEITPEGGTNLAAALDLGYKTALRHYSVGSINHVVLLTDGAANLGDVDPAALNQKVETHRKQGIALDCFGIGWEGLNDDMLEQLSRNGDGRYGFINTPEEAATNFAGQLAGALRVAASDVKVQVEWNPKRVTAYRQVGYAKHQLTKEQFRDNSVDAAELAAAESGNALYVVEVNPRGEGDLATVRVRFKVPGTSDYREHEWAVPFTRAAAPLDESSSTLRLAASAAAFSEMLAGSPFATEVTSDRLLQLVNGLPAIYGADPRPQKLEWMIRQAKSLSGR